MPRNAGLSFKAGTLFALMLSLHPAVAGETAIYTFKGGSDGAEPMAGLIADNSGNFYGMTGIGGVGTDCVYSSDGCGTVFELKAGKKEKVLYSFAGGCDGAFPGYGALTADGSGNLYGATGAGGACNDRGFGTVFRRAPNGAETVLYAFQDGTDGGSPTGSVIFDSAGNLYGTAFEGGAYDAGVVFELAPDGSETVLHAFQGGSDGSEPGAGVVMGSEGNLYGTTELGGGGTGCGFGAAGCGTIFELTPDGTENILHAFQGGTDGALPSGALLLDNSGYLYGTTRSGGSGGQGTVFKLAPDGTETVFYSFTGGSDGGDPQAGLVMDSKGDMYGTTFGGGAVDSCGKAHGCGVVFQVTPTGTEKVLYAFTKKYGLYPESTLLLDKHGALYGTASQGGGVKNPDCVVPKKVETGCGVVFEVKK